MSSNYNDIENYCKDCDRSIYGAYHNCDTNIENDGRYTKPGSPCYCKCRQGVGMVEKYPWQLDYTISIREAIKEITRWTGYLDTDMVTRIQTGLRKLPPAQPERKKGKWIIDGHHIKCNQCGKSMCNTDREGDAIPRNFCPNCGAEMMNGGYGHANADA